MVETKLTAAEKEAIRTCSKRTLAVSYSAVTRVGEIVLFGTNHKREYATHNALPKNSES